MVIILQRPKSSWAARSAEPDRVDRATICGRKSRGESDFHLRLLALVDTGLASLGSLSGNLMNRYRNAPGFGGPSKASPTTLCQKCLKRDMSPSAAFLILLYADFAARHYSYECKATTQERPYISRPSRTQQLQNPRLMPKLSNDVPDDLQRSYVLGCFRKRDL